MKAVARLFPVVAVVLLSACAQPLPPDRLDYVGEWRAPGMALVITQGGQVAYQRQNGNVKTTINAPLQRFEGSAFLVGIGPFHTRFEVNAPPHREGASWRMTIDGVELTRVDGPAVGQEPEWRSGGNQKVRI